jgi:putative CocE/NonD family hydrolase
MTNNTGDDVVYVDRRTADRRLLTYMSEPLVEDMEITGQPVVMLHITSTHTDGAFVVNFEEVAPDDYVRYLTGGQLRAIHRKISADEPPYRVLGPYHSLKRKDGSPLVAGEVAEITFELMPVSVVVRAGHRLRVAIAGCGRGYFPTDPGKDVPTVFAVRRLPVTDCSIHLDLEAHCALFECWRHSRQ